VSSDPIKDFAPVAHFGALPTIVVVPFDSKANSVQDLVNMAKADPGGVSFASAGSGGPAHLAGELLASMTGTKMTHVPFRGAAPALTEVMAGRVNFTFYTMAGLKEQLEAKRLRALAITAPKRHPDFAAVPTMTEAGFPGFEEVGAWFGIVAPAGTPAPIVARLNDAFNRALRSPKALAWAQSEGLETIVGTSEAFAATIADGQGHWAETIKRLGIAPR